MAKLIIGFVGHKDSGKSSTARLLTDEIHRSFPNCVDKASFSQPIYDMLIALGVPRGNVYDNRMRDHTLHDFGGKTSRQLMTTLGTEWGRDMIHNDLWIDRSISSMETRDAKVFMVDGIRFHNEADKILDAGGCLVHVANEKTTPEGEVHESEKHIEALSMKCDFGVDNTNWQIREEVPTLCDLILERYAKFFAKMLTK